MATAQKPKKFNGYPIQVATDKVVLIEYNLRKNFIIWNQEAESCLYQFYQTIKKGDTKQSQKQQAPADLVFSAEIHFLEERLRYYLSPINAGSSKSGLSTDRLYNGYGTEEQRQFQVVLRWKDTAERIKLEWLMRNRRVEPETNDGVSLVLRTGIEPRILMEEADKTGRMKMESQRPILDYVRKRKMAEGVEDSDKRFKLEKGFVEAGKNTQEEVNMDLEN